jgi:hypothetical protein
MRSAGRGEWNLEDRGPPSPMSLGMLHLSEDEDRRLHSPKLPTVIDELFQCLRTLSSKLESAEHVASATRRRTKHHTSV